MKMAAACSAACCKFHKDDGWRRGEGSAAIFMVEPMSASFGAPNEIRGTLNAMWRPFAIAGLFSGFINLLYLASPLYLMQVYNRVLVSSSLSTLALLTLLLAVALLAMALVDALRAQILVRCGVALDQQLGPRIFNALIGRSAHVGSSRGAQQLREFDQFRGFITGSGVYFLFDLPWIPLYLLLLFLIHPLLGIVATAGCAVLFGLAVLNEMLTRRNLVVSENAANQSYGFTDNILRYADVVQAMGMQPAIERHWQASRTLMLGENAVASDRNGAVSAAIRFARLLLQGLMLCAGAVLAINNDIMPATIFASSIVMGRALVPVEQAVAAWKNFNSARDNYHRLVKLLEEEPLPGPRSHLPVQQGSVAAKDIVYTTPLRPEPILKGMSFTLEAGKAIGIIGPSGSGKSTLARVLVGAVPPTRGTLAFGNVDYTRWDPVQLGREVGYLPQEVGLFAGTVRENIARFADVSMDEIIRAAEVAGVHGMILKLPQQYDTRLGSGGVGLSGGQRQRIGLARALLGNPSLLVLDEPNANLDTTGEQALKAALEERKAMGTTIVLITHRTSILEVVDLLMVVRDGALDMIGTPNLVHDHIQRGLIRPPSVATV
jgi:ATP-binding cassette, subfamily C, bacterial exporter for protease/lipase